MASKVPERSRSRGQSIQNALGFGQPSPPPGGQSRPPSGSTQNTSEGPTPDEKKTDPISPIGARGKKLSFAEGGRTIIGGREDFEIPHSPDIRHDQRAVNTIPPFILSVDDDDDVGPDAHLLPLTPDGAVVATHNYLPTSTDGHNSTTSKSTMGKTIRQPRSTNPKSPKSPSSFPFPSQKATSTPQDHPHPHRSRWAALLSLPMTPATAPEGEKLVDNTFLESQTDYSGPWRPNRLDSSSNEGTYVAFQRRRQVWWRRFQHTLLRSPIVPLIFRLTVWVFSLIALALGSSIHHLADTYHHPQGPSSEMAVIVDAIALVYILYITYDEYTGKPLGLRSAKAKMRLIFLDLFFIVFDSANLALAFESLSDVRSACVVGEVNGSTDPRIDDICDRQIALATTLLIALIAWILTFTVSIFRLVERVSQ